MLTMIKKLRELRQNERMTRAELESAKLDKFRALVRHAKERSPYYAEIVERHRIDVATCSPADFPVLTKSSLLAHFDQIVTDRRITKRAVREFLDRSNDPNELLFGEYHVLHTSGSSGEIGLFVFSEDDWQRGMAQSLRPPRQPAPRPRRFRRTRVAFYGATGGHFAGVTVISSARRGIAPLFVNLRVFEINAPLPDVVAQLNAFQPDLLTGYTTGAKVLAQEQRRGALRIAPFEVLTTGEAMPRADRELIEAAFGCPASNGYGSTEHLVMGGANRDDGTMTLFEDDLIYAIEDDHTLVTNLFNRTLPLIRYHMTDVLRPVPANSPRARAEAPYTVIHGLVGRAEETPWFVNRDGADDFIHPLTVVELYFPGVLRFQLRVIDKTSFRFAVVLDPSLDAARQADAIAAVERRWRELLAQKKLDNLAFEVVAKDDLRVSPVTGKFQLIVRAPGEPPIVESARRAG